VLVTEHTDQYPRPSPEGDELLFVRDRGDLMLYDLEDDELHDAAGGLGRARRRVGGRRLEHIVFSRMDLQFNSDIFLMNVDAVEDDPDSEAAQPVNITRHPDLDLAPRLSHDGKVLYFLSDRAAPENWTYDVFAVFLDDSLEDLAGYELDEYFEEAKKAAGKLKPAEPWDEEDEGDDEGDDEGSESDDPEPFEFDTDDAYLRVRRITSIPESEGNLAITPAGDRVLFTSIDGERGLYSVDHRGASGRRSWAAGTPRVSTSLTGGKAVFVNGGQAHHAPPAGARSTTLGIDAPVTVDTAPWSGR
jgi:tricorn protease